MSLQSLRSDMISLMYRATTERDQKIKNKWIAKDKTTL